MSNSGPDDKAMAMPLTISCAAGLNTVIVVISSCRYSKA
jgi:hypothetical protein